MIFVASGIFLILSLILICSRFFVISLNCSGLYWLYCEVLRCYDFVGFVVL